MCKMQKNKDGHMLSCELQASFKENPDRKNSRKMTHSYN